MHHILATGSYCTSSSISQPCLRLTRISQIACKHYVYYGLSLLHGRYLDVISVISSSAKPMLTARSYLSTIHTRIISCAIRHPPASE